MNYLLQNKYNEDMKSNYSRECFFHMQNTWSLSENTAHLMFILYLHENNRFTFPSLHQQIIIVDSLFAE